MPRFRLSRLALAGAAVAAGLLVTAPRWVSAQATRHLTAFSVPPPELTGSQWLNTAGQIR